MAVPFYDENIYLLKVRQDLESKTSELALLVERLNATDINSFPATSIMKQLAAAIKAGKRSSSMKDFLVSSGSSSPVRKRATLSLSTMKSLVLCDNEDKFGFELRDEEKLASLVGSLFDAKEKFLSREIGYDLKALTSTPCLHKDIHSAPPGSFVVKLAEVIGSFTTLRRMALFWSRVVSELRRCWAEGEHIPGIPVDEVPDLGSCLLHQWLQVMNCSLTRKEGLRIASETLDAVMRQANNVDEESDTDKDMVSQVPLLYARTCSGEIVLRLGAHHQVDNLTMLETGEPVYAPVTQEGPLLTEDLIKETQELVLRTGSLGAGCSQLLSDMQAFKAANPGCVMEDCVRWHSPPDWTENETSTEEFDSASIRGQLSTRMQKEGNLWRELWETAKSVPAVKQTPLFDYDLAVEGILICLEDIPAAQLFEQLFLSLLGLGFVISEPKLATNNYLAKLFIECKDYVITICQGGSWTDKLDDLCRVYETVETMLLRPDEAISSMKQTEVSPKGAEPVGRFRKLGMMFGSKENTQQKLPLTEEQKGQELQSPNWQHFSSFFDGKSSLFSKKPPKPNNSFPPEKTTLSA